MSGYERREILRLLLHVYRIWLGIPRAVAELFCTEIVNFLHQNVSAYHALGLQPITPAGEDSGEQRGRSGLHPPVPADAVPGGSCADVERSREQAGSRDPSHVTETRPAAEGTS